MGSSMMQRGEGTLGPQTGSDYLLVSMPRGRSKTTGRPIGAKRGGCSLATLPMCGTRPCVWGKNNFAISGGHYHFQHEPCWYAVREGSTGHWCGGHKQTSVWHIDKPQKSETGHSTQKPVECMKRPIENNSSAGQAVYDPFVGSGTTIIAAEMTGRACHAIELYPAYVDVAMMRWQNFTGKEAILETTGETFTEVAISAGIPPR